MKVANLTKSISMYTNKRENNDTTEIVDNNYMEIEIEKIIINKNIRENIKEQGLIELLASIKEYGLLNPITVYKENENYVVITGHRRYNAFKLGGIQKIPCFIVQKDFEERRIEIQLIENIQRENLSIEELRKSLLILYEKYKTIEKVGFVLNRSKSWVSKNIKLQKFEKNETIEKGKIEMEDKKGNYIINGLKLKISLEVEKKETIEEIINFLNKR